MNSPERIAELETKLDAAQRETLDLQSRLTAAERERDEAKADQELMDFVESECLYLNRSGYRGNCGIVASVADPGGHYQEERCRDVGHGKTRRDAITSAMEGKSEAVERNRTIRQEHKALTAKLEEVTREQTETGEAWEILAASFPTIQVDCENQESAAREINEIHERVVSERDQLRADLAQLEAAKQHMALARMEAGCPDDDTLVMHCRDLRAQLSHQASELEGPIEPMLKLPDGTEWSAFSDGTISANDGSGPFVEISKEDVPRFLAWLFPHYRKEQS